MSKGRKESNISMDNKKYKTYPAIQSLSGWTVPPIGVVVINETSNKKRVTKR